MRTLLELLIKDNDVGWDTTGKEFHCYCISSSVCSLLCLLLYFKIRMKDKESVMKAFRLCLFVGMAFNKESCIILSLRS